MADETALTDAIGERSIDAVRHYLCDAAKARVTDAQIARVMEAIKNPSEMYLAACVEAALYGVDYRHHEAHKHNDAAQSTELYGDG